MSTVMTRWLVIGLSGVTCGGKTTVSRKLHENFENSVYVNQDSYFLPIDDPRHEYIKELNHHNWDIITSMDVEKMHMDVLKLMKSSENMKNTFCDKYHCNTRVLIIDGFLIFDYKPIENLCHFKYFFTMTKQQCWQRRQTRLYDPPDVPDYFDKIVWPQYETYKDKIEKDHEMCRSIIFIDGGLTVEEIFQKIYNDVKKIIVMDEI